MTREDIIRMAREAGLSVGDVKGEFSAEVTTEIFCRDHDYYEANPEIGYLVQTHDFLRFADLVAAHERERIIAANAPEIEKVNAHIKALEDELKALREFAAGRCTIQKVINELGPMSLWSYAAMEKKLDEARAEEREECAKVCDEVGGRDTDSHAWDAAAAIRARGQA